jgi:hypothetical protein
VPGTTSKQKRRIFRLNQDANASSKAKVEMSEMLGRGPSANASETFQKSQRRITPNIPAIENLLKRGLGRDFATGKEKEGKEKERAVETISSSKSISEQFQAMLLADTNARQAKSKVQS